MLKATLVHGPDGLYNGCEGLAYCKISNRWTFALASEGDAPLFEALELDVVLQAVRDAGFKLPKHTGSKHAKDEPGQGERRLFYQADGTALVIIKGCALINGRWRFLPPNDVSCPTIRASTFDELVAQIKAAGIGLPEDFGSALPYEHTNIAVRKKRLSLKMGGYDFWPGRQSILFPYSCPNTFNDAMRSALRVREMVKNAAKLIRN